MGKATWERVAKAAVRDLSVHAAIEEGIFYPAVTREVPDLSEVMLRSLESHSVVKWLCSAISSTLADDDRFGPRMTVLIDNVRLHVEEEEDDIFPEVRQALGRKRLVAYSTSSPTERVHSIPGKASTHRWDRETSLSDLRAETCCSQ